MANEKASTTLVDPVIVLYTNAATPVAIDITKQVSSIELTNEADVHDVTTFGNRGQRNTTGLTNGSVKLEFYTNFDEDDILETLLTFWNGTKLINFEASQDNYTGNMTLAVSGTMVMNSLPTFNGKVGEENTGSVTYPLDGEPTIDLS